MASCLLFGFNNTEEVRKTFDVFISTTWLQPCCDRPALFGPLSIGLRRAIIECITECLCSCSSVLAMGCASRRAEKTNAQESNCCPIASPDAPRHPEHRGPAPPRAATAAVLALLLLLQPARGHEPPNGRLDVAIACVQRRLRCARLEALWNNTHKRRRVKRHTAAGHTSLKTTTEPHRGAIGGGMMTGWSHESIVSLHTMSTICLRTIAAWIDSIRSAAAAAAAAAAAPAPP
jgi:hypothetical protein